MTDRKITNEDLEEVERRGEIGGVDPEADAKKRKGPDAGVTPKPAQGK